MSAPRAFPSVLVLFLVGVFVVSLLPGCAESAPVRLAGPTRSVEGRPGESGLGVRVWIVRDQSHAIARALHDAQQAPLPLAMRRTLRDSGLRVLAVPIDRLDDLRARLPIGGPTQRQWLARVPRWHTAVDGPRSMRPARVMLDSGPLALEPGWARLSVRAWVEPVLDQSRAGAPIFAGRMRIELVPEHVMVATARTLGGGTVGEDRFVFDRLTARWLATPGMAYLVVAERPEADWGELALLPDEPTTVARIVRDTASEQRDPAGPEPMPPDEPEASPLDERVRDGPSMPGAVSFPVLGPRSPLTPTLGEAILGSPAYAGSRAPIRAVLVLVPVAPERFELLPR